MNALLHSLGSASIFERSIKCITSFVKLHVSFHTFNALLICAPPLSSLHWQTEQFRDQQLNHRLSRLDRVGLRCSIVLVEAAVILLGLIFGGLDGWQSKRSPPTYSMLLEICPWQREPNKGFNSVKKFG